MRQGLVFKRHGNALVPALAIILASGEALVVEGAQVVSPDVFDRDFTFPGDDSEARTASADEIKGLVRSREQRRAELAASATIGRGSPSNALAEVNAATDAALSKINAATDRLLAALAQAQANAGSSSTPVTSTPAAPVSSSPAVVGSIPASTSPSTDPNDKGPVSSATASPTADTFGG